MEKPILLQSLCCHYGRAGIEAFSTYLPSIQRGMESIGALLAASVPEDEDDTNGMVAGNGTSRVPYMKPGRNTYARSWKASSTACSARFLPLKYLDEGRRRHEERLEGESVREESCFFLHTTRTLSARILAGCSLQ